MIDKIKKENKLELKVNSHVIAVRIMENGFYYDFYHRSDKPNEFDRYVNYIGRFKRDWDENVNKKSFEDLLAGGSLTEKDRQVVTDIVDILNVNRAGYITLAWAVYSKKEEGKIEFKHEK